MEDNKSTLQEPEQETDVIEENTCPPISKELLEHLEETFDTRKMLSYSVELEYLKGIQAVLNYMRYKFDNKTN